LNSVWNFSSAVFVVIGTVVVKHFHGGFQVLEALAVDFPDLFVGDFAPHDNSVEVVGCRIF
jgi:hypothetical protein